MKPIPNGRSGVLIFHGSNNVIGGTGPGERNVISGNTRNGINIDSSALRPERDIVETSHLPTTRSPSKGNRVVGNYIGVDATGAGPLPNGLNGILLFMCQSNRIGGSGPGEGNVISANKRFGVLVTGPNPDTPDWRVYARDIRMGTLVKTVEEHELEPLDAQDGNAILGNAIGTDALRERAMGNEASGIGVFFMPNTVIGDETPGSGNVLSGNALHGITLTGVGVKRTRIRNNRIGLAGGTGGELKNGGIGVLFRDMAEAFDATVLAAEGNAMPPDRRSVVIRQGGKGRLGLDSPGMLCTQ